MAKPVTTPLLAYHFQIAMAAFGSSLAFAMASHQEKVRLAREFVLAMGRYQSRLFSKTPVAQHQKLVRNWFENSADGAVLRARFPAMREHVCAELPHVFDETKRLEHEWSKVNDDPSNADRAQLAAKIVEHIGTHTEQVAQVVASHADVLPFAIEIFNLLNAASKS